MRALYKQNQDATLEIIPHAPFSLEKDLQNLFEENINALTGLQLVKSEFSVTNKRIDTLAYDQENKAFVIIEYKRNRSYSVVDQGMTYLNLMLENKAEFIVEYNESKGQHLKRKDGNYN